MNEPTRGPVSRSANTVEVNADARQAFEIVGLFLEGTDRDATLLKIAQELHVRGFVSAEYGAKVVEREKEFPTGLATEPVSVAIPHSDKEYVYRSVVAVVRLKDPVVFRNMGAPEEELRVELILFLAVPPDKDQVLMIQAIMEVVQNPDALVGLLNAETEQALAVILQKSCIKQQEKNEVKQKE